MSEKISVEHLKRTAYIYIRQSSSQQVRFHLESQKRQYGLAERARQLGFHEVVVIDEDLGRSGAECKNDLVLADYWRRCVREWLERWLLWRPHDWLAIIGTGITWWICVP